MNKYAIKQAHRFARKPTDVRMVRALTRIRNRAHAFECSEGEIMEAVEVFFATLKAKMKSEEFVKLCEISHGLSRGAFFPYMERGKEPMMPGARIDEVN